MKMSRTDWLELWRKLPTHLTHPDPEIFLSENYLTLDLETTNEDKGDPANQANSIVSAGWLVSRPGEEAVYHTRRADQFHLPELVAAVEAADFVVAHVAKFEAGWLARCGVDVRGLLFYDTAIGDYVLSGNRTGDRWAGRPWLLSLHDCLKRYGLPSHKKDIASQMIRNGTLTEEIPKHWLAEYLKSDVIMTDKLFRRQRDELVAEGLLPVHLTRCLSVPTLAMMEPRGFCLDPDRVRWVGREMKMRLDAEEKELEEITGGINLRSPPQKRDYLYSTLKFPVPKKANGQPMVTKKTGLPSTDEKALDALVPKTQKQQQFVDGLRKFNKVNSAWSKYLNKFVACVETEEEPILYCSFNQTKTSTHRTSSTGKKYAAQFQNFDNRFKPVFCAREPGWSVGEADYAQLEYRVAVFLGDDANGRRDIAQKVDAHGFTASIIFEEAWGGDLSPFERKGYRTKSKAHTFKPLYGGQSGTDAEQRYYKAFRDKHQGITDVQQEWIDEVLRTGKLVTRTGLVFYWPDTKVQRSGYVTNTTSICNYQVQMLATADIVPVGVVYLDALLHYAGLRTFVVNTVHDSGVAEVAPGEEETWEYLAQQGMVKATLRYLRLVYGIDFDVPLEVEVSNNAHWSGNPEWDAQWLGETHESEG